MQIDTGAAASFATIDPARNQQQLQQRQQVAEQAPGAADQVQESRDATRQAVVAVEQRNTQQQTIETFVNASSDSSSSGDSGLTGADVLEASQNINQRRATIEVLDRAQNGELQQPSVNPLGQFVDTTV
ncbi:hypothetical protein ACFSJ3_02445 [Corallincola platygyrae]|uniref:Uncharacterized protein n=1 Tax=Corallincola platygyrae TaxID=1193278 RepID=A0ABW4XKQ6_9GAMM